MPFMRYVEVGRITLVNYGKLVVIVDVIDQNRSPYRLYLSLKLTSVVEKLLYFDRDQNGGLNLALQTNTINFGMSPMGLLEIYTSQMKLQVFGYQDNDPNTEMSYPYFEIMRNQGKQKNRINSSNIFPLLMLCGIVDDACFLFAESAIQYSGKSSALTDTIRVANLGENMKNLRFV
ncbi:hypothetical protein L1987_70543 [Smallanthus sonchifolius]|uniref:Uncharacterized protein n=1 Tax=Smallanthus sonchifolius TaxID=185202 RepID=A0ACB9APL3_9ASTR|nr:hypothetical protein L1987_70543 [Smallanthus sonchifolius]